jgi:uncharacterized protein (TIGR02646 family)
LTPATVRSQIDGIQSPVKGTNVAHRSQDVIPIDHDSVRPDDRWFKAAAAATAKLAEFYRQPLDQRIQHRSDFHVEIWLRVKDEVATKCRRKCAYCETLLGVSDLGDIDHFRPKRDAVGITKEAPHPDHYWWLAYEWTNLYLACRMCNFAKGPRFPVQGGKRATATSTGDELRRQELALLVDPGFDKPFEHLTFDREGFVHPKPGSAKGSVTIEVLQLNRPNLVQARRERIEFALSIVAQGVQLGRLREVASLETPYTGAVAEVVASWLKENFGAAFIKSFWESMKGLAEPITGLFARWLPGPGSAKAPRIAQPGATSSKSARKPEAPSAAPKPVVRAKLKTQFITQVTIHNFRAIDDVTIRLPPPESGGKPWVVLLGENATGKSSILKAVALALMGEAGRRALEIEPTQVLRHGKKEGFVEVEVFGCKRPFRLEFGPDGGFASDGQAFESVLLGYGGTRLMRPGVGPKSGPSRLVRVASLFDPFQPLGDARGWLLGLDGTLFGLAARAVKTILGQGDSASLKRLPPEEPREIVLNLPWDRHPTKIEELSDGYQSALALATDLLEMVFRDWKTDPENAEAVVLIDELDVHLHPRWKAEVVGLLRRAFPRIQFLVTTHDPLCLLGTRPGEVHVLRRHPETRRVRAHQVDVPPGTSADRILTGFWFGLDSTLDDGTLKLLDRHRALLRAGTAEDDPERMALERTLRRRLGTFADTSLDRLAQDAAAEVMGEDAPALDPERREALRRGLVDYLREVR